MTKFTPLVDSNTKNVLQWTMTSDSGEELVKSIPKKLWKLEKDWSEEELNNLFDSKEVVLLQEPKIEEPESEPEPENTFIFEDVIEEPLPLEDEKKSFLEN
jgi:hypothetical protein